MKDIFAVVRNAALIVLLLAFVSPAGATNYIFKAGNYYMGVTNGQLVGKTTFDMTCIWTASDGSGNEKSLGGSSDQSALYTVEGTTRRYIHDTGGYTLSLETGADGNKRFYLDGSTLKYKNAFGTTYFVTYGYNGAQWEVRTQSGRGTHPSVTTESSRTTVTGGTTYTITGPTVSPTSWTATELNAKQTFTASATASKSVSPSYNTISLGGSTYYIRTDNQVRSTTVPTTSSSTITVSYAWGNSELPAGSTMTTSEASSTVTYSTAQTDADKTGTLTLRVTAVDGSTTTSTYKDASVSVTVKKIPKFYYSASTAVNITGVGTVSVTPTSGNITGTSASQTSATASLTYKASVNSGNENLYQFAGWSTDGTAAGIIKNSDVASYTYTANVTSQNSASPTAVKLTAIFNKLSRLKVAVNNGMGYVYSCGDSPYSGSDPFSGKLTSDVTTRTDGKSHTMYMYAKSLQQTVSGVTTDQFKFKGWSSTNSHDNIDGGTTAYGQTITVGSPEYKEMYAMFKRYFKFKVEGVAMSNGVESTEGGTVVATFTGKSPAGTTSTDEWEVETVTENTATVTTRFTATALNGYQFKGWYSDAALTQYVNGANPYAPELQNTATGTTATMKLYAKFTLETPPTSINIGSDFSLPVSGTKDLVVVYTPNTAATHKFTKFVSSNPAVATVNETTGHVVAVTPGEAVITATAYNPDDITPACTHSVKVTVTAQLPNPVITVTADPDDLNRALVTIEPGTGSPTETKIYYTINGLDPTTASTLYTAPFYIQNLTTVKAISTSTLPGWSNSEVVSKGYSKQKAKRPIIDIDGNDVTFYSESEPNVTYIYTIDGSTPTTGHGTTWTTAQGPITNIPTDKTIKVIATKDMYGPSDVAEAYYQRKKVPTPEIQVAGDRTWFLCGETGVTYYYTTDGSDPTTSSATSDGSEITTIPNGATIKVFAVKSGYRDSEVTSKKKATTQNIVYLDFTSGNDSNDGKTAATAKKTWAGAYALLGFGPNATYLRGQWSANGLAVATHTAFNGDPVSTKYTNTVDNNIIYLVGDVSSSNLDALMNYNVVNAPTSEQTMMNTIVGSGFFKPATISGKYATSRSDADGAYARISMSPGTNYALKEDTRFEYVEFYGTNNSATNETQFILCYYDLEMGKGMRVQNFLSTKNFSTYHHGYAQGVTNTAHILFYGGVVCDKRFRSTTRKELDFDYYLPHPDGYKITIRSGYFSTISPGGKQWDNQSSLTGTMGSPNTPVKCTMLVDIDRAWNDRHKSGVVLNQSTVGDPNCDVAVLIAGTHEGSMYGDVDIIVKSGKVDRVVNGSFGAHNQVPGYPCDSYFGRANTLIDPREPSAAEVAAGYTTKDKLVEIRELYGGGLGRYKSTSGSAEAATNFYGKSTVTINGGTFSSAIYASGAGGCNGIGDDTHHAVDQYLPYWSSADKTGVTYGTYANWKASANKLKVTCHNSSKSGDVTEIDLAKTNTKIEIHGGIFGSSSATIDGIYGGGYGYVDEELIHYTGVPPHTQAGSILAAAGDTASSVLIDGKTEIWGSVYAAGRGTDVYATSSRSDKANYRALALISGNTYLTIGGKVKVHGGVYGAGKGISSLTDMARHYGSTSVTIKDRAQILGGVYGGGQDGSMDGSNVVNLLGDAVIGTADANANVHGGGYGSTTNVNGNVAVNIGKSSADEPVIYGDVYGGSALGQVNSSSTDSTIVTMNSGTVNGSIYGGGLGNSTTAANVNGNIQVNVFAGTVKPTTVLGSGGVYGCNNVNGTPKANVAVDIYGTDPAVSVDEYALYAVYGGGNQSAFTGTPKVTVHYCDNSIQYVYGGGNAAAVAGTDVTIWGGNIIGNVFGGGNGSSEGWPSGTENPGANVTTNGTKVKIYGGTILSVFGGSNTKGLITGGTSVVVNAHRDSTDKKATDACPVDVDNLYGAGNNAPFTGNTSVQILHTGLNGAIGNVFGGGKGNTATVTGNTDVQIGDLESTHIAQITGSVFGGGDQAQTTGTANVTLKDCSTTVAGDVYGGGNQSLVGNTNTTIWGGTVQGDLYGAGRGTDAVSADVGTASVKGNATTNVYGGNFGGIFGGGNIKSDVTGTAKLFIDEQVCPGGTQCDFSAGEVYGAGNKAKISGIIDFSLGCLSGKIAELYGGAKEADIDNSVVLNISSGKFGSIFGGNNLGGVITGTITVNVQHTGCQPIVIDTLYGGGNLADYAVPASSTNKNYPEINIKTCGKSPIDWKNDGLHCLKVGTIFGGGKGKHIPGDERGKVTGNPHVNVYGGEIGTIYGGGNAADIVGNTNVFIVDQNASDKQDIFVMKNVYGGGNEAAVTGTTNVQIGPKLNP